MLGPARGGRSTVYREGSGHVALEAAALLLREPAPDAVALAVAERPRQADLLDPAHPAVGQSKRRILLGRREEDLRVDAVAGRLVLPRVRRGRVPGELVQVDVGKHVVHRSAIEYPAGRHRK